MPKGNNKTSLCSAATFNLRSQRSDQDAASDLATSEVLLSGLFRRLRQGDFNYEHYRALVIEEIRNSTFQDVGGFFSKYFEGKDWSEATEAIYRDVQSGDVDGKWTEFPDPPIQNDVFDWLFRFQDELLSDACGVYFTTTSKKDLIGSDAERQVDLRVREARRQSMTGRTSGWSAS